MAFFECTYRIGLTEIGKSNKITNKAVIKILENAGGMHSDVIGYGVNQINDTKLSWVLLNWKIKILKRALYNTELKIKTWARDTNKITTCRDYEMYDENGELIIIATSKWTLINIDTKKLEMLPIEMINKYDPEEKTAFESGKIERLVEPDCYDSELEYKILRSDIDINEHVHNLYYLDFAYEALPEEIYKGEECNNIEILYKKQIKLCDKIKCMYAREENKNIIAIKSDDEKTLHSIIYLY